MNKRTEEEKSTKEFYYSGIDQITMIPSNYNKNHICKFTETVLRRPKDEESNVSLKCQVSILRSKHYYDRRMRWIVDLLINTNSIRKSKETFGCWSESTQDLWGAWSITLRPWLHKRYLFCGYWSYSFFKILGVMRSGFLEKKHIQEKEFKRSLSIPQAVY
jgi:hypothetical protein